MIQSKTGDNMEQQESMLFLCLNEISECAISVLYVMYSSMSSIQTGHSDIAKFRV